MTLRPTHSLAFTGFGLIKWLKLFYIPVYLQQENISVIKTLNIRQNYDDVFFTIPTLINWNKIRFHKRVIII